MTKIKVAFFAEILIEDFDGASRTMYQILNRIPRAEFEFMFFCAVPPDKELGFEVMQLPAFRVPFNSTYKVAFPFFSKRKMSKKMEAFQPDIIHIASPSPLGNFAKQFAAAHAIPVVTIYHTHFIAYIKYYFRSLPFLIDLMYRKSVSITRNFYQSPNLVFAPSQQIIEELQSVCKLDGKNLKLWQRGIDQQLFNPEKKDKQFMQSIVGNDWPTILFVSRLVWEKNLKTLIGLYQLCQAQNAQVNFVVAGDGVARKQAEAQMPEAFFMGMIKHEELAKVYASADVFFFPSDTESFGNVVIEAMASGIPCVVADGGGPKSFIQNDVNGFLCAPNDVAAYWENIKYLLEDESARQKMIAAGIAFTDTLSWKNLVSTYFEELKNLLP